MRRIIFFTLIVLLSINVKSQNWPVYYGGAGTETGKSMILNIPQPMSKVVANLVIAGATNSVGAGGSDMYLVKVDADGNSINEKTFGTINNESANAISVFQGWSDPFISFLVAGYTTTASGKDIYIAKIDTSLTEIYSPSSFINNQGDDEINCLRFLNMGEIFAAGYKTNALGDKDLYIMKLFDNFSNIDSSITLTYGGSGDDVAFSIDGDPNGIVGAVGYTNSFGSGGKDIYLATYDAMQGFSMYDTTYGGSGDEIAYDVIYSPLYSAFYIVGSTTSYGNGGKDIYLLKIDAYNGDTVWTKTYGGAGDEEGFDIDIQGDFYGESYNLVITGYSTSFGAGDKDTYTIKINPADGEEIWSKIWGLPSVDEEATTVKYDECNWYISGTSGQDMFMFSFPEPKAQITFYIDDVTCTGFNNGHIFAEVSPVSFIQNFWWSNQETTDDIYNLSSGTYYLNYNDGFCNTLDSAVVNEPELLTASLSQLVIGCYNDTDKVATLLVTGGVEPYSYIWSSGGSDEIEYNLPVGGVGATVTDNNGCINYDYFSIIDAPSAIIAVTASQQAASCYGYCDGKATINVTGGSGVFQFLWDDTSSQTDSIATGLCAGNYSVTVTDSYECEFKLDTFYIDEPYFPYLEANIVEPSCYGLCDASITLTYIDGIFPFSYQWEFGGTDSLVTNVCSGDITLSVFDGNSCQYDTTFSVGTPVLLDAFETINNAICQDVCNGVISLNISGGVSPYTINWSNSESTSTISQLCAGQYDVTIQDANTCTEIYSYTVTANTAIVLNSNSNNVLCNGQSTGSALVVPTGGVSPYVYTWSNGSTSSSLNGIPAGNYSVTITDVNGCIATTSINISEPTALATAANITNASCDLTCTGQISKVVNGGTSPYSYLWSNGLTTSTIINLCAGNYIVTVQDANSCQDVKSHTVGIMNTSTINGLIQHNIYGFNANAVQVQLYKKNTNNLAYTNISNVTNTAGGAYSFSNLISGEYYIKAKMLDNATYQNVLNTYYPNAIDWNYASILTIGCENSYNYNVMMQNSYNGTTGGATISGNITIITPSKSIEGEPVPGADITLEQEPDDEPIANNTTDVNGGFTFNNVGSGNYSLRVDIPGLPQIDTIKFNIANDTSLVNMNYIVDTSSTNFGIYANPQTGIGKYNFENFSVSIYPNPAVSEINVNLSFMNKSDFVFEMIDNKGGKIISREYKSLANETIKETIDVKNLVSGTYYIRIKSENSVLVKKVIKL